MSPSPVHYQYYPVQTSKTSIHDAIDMLGLAKRINTTIFKTSTGDVCRDPKVHPQPEDYCSHVNPIASSSCYDEGKRCAETLFFDYRRQHNLHIKVAYIFNTYGHNMRLYNEHITSNCIMPVLRTEFITLSGDGSQTSNSELAFRPLPPDDPRQRQPDITLAGTTLGWPPNPPWEKGLEKNIDYFSDILSVVSQ